MTIIRASVVQACTANYGDAKSLQLTLEKMDHFTAIAKERDSSQLAVFPEAFIGGYPSGTHFDTVMGNRTAQGRQQYLDYHKCAVEIPSEATRQVESISKKHGVFLVSGIVERDGGTLYCSVIFVHPDKGLVGKHRKLMPTGTERLVWGFGDATTLPVIEETFTSSEGEPVKAKVATNICWENYMPLLRTYYYSKGVQIYCAPTVDSRPTWQHTVSHIALEGRCHVLSSCQYALQKDFSSKHPIPSHLEVDPEGLMMGGGSVIINPRGETIAGPLRGEEGVISADLDLDDHIRGKYDMDCVGHYARNDIFELIVKGV